MKKCTLSNKIQITENTVNYLYLLGWFLAGSLGRFVQKKLGTLNLWEDSFHTVKENLKAGIIICEQWVAACDHLTGQLWQRYTPHIWRGEKYIPETLGKLGKRLEEVSVLACFRDVRTREKYNLKAFDYDVF